MAERKGDFKYSNEKEKDNKYEFEGSENEITLSRIYDEGWICNYDMRLITIVKLGSWSWSNSKFLAKRTRADAIIQMHPPTTPHPPPNFSTSI